MKNIEEQSWQDLKDCGLLWWINRTLHLFGWAIVLEYDDNDQFKRAYPVKTSFRGFSEEVESKNFMTLTTYLKNNIRELEEEVYSE